MDHGVYIALSGAKLQELRLELTANNLANASTAGYKSDRIMTRPFIFDLEESLNELDDFRDIEAIRNMDYLDQTLTVYNGSYAKTGFVGTEFSQGYHKFTGSPLNFSLEGPGFVAVETPAGDRYTRQGSYSLNSDGELVTPDGYRVRGRGLSGLGEGELSIDSIGNVLIDGERAGSIDIVEFENPQALRKEGHNYFVQQADGNLEKDAENTVIKQGYLEMPNISVVTEMVNLIELNRMYEAYQKNITTIDESIKTLIEKVGGN